MSSISKLIIFSGIDGGSGENGDDGPRGYKGPDGEIDLESLFLQIKEMVRPYVKCKHCVPPKKQKPPTKVPINAVFLIDGSDSIRGVQGEDLNGNEWQLSSSAVQVNYFLRYR